MNKDDILTVPEGYAGLPQEWIEMMTFKYIKELLEERHFSIREGININKEFGVNADSYNINNIGLRIDYYKFDLDKFYAKYGPTKGSKDVAPKPLKVDKLKKLTCECCNATLDPSRIKDNIIRCEFCGTKYIVN